MWTKSITRIFENWVNLRNYSEGPQLEKKFPKHGERFIRLQKYLGLSTTQAMLHFLLTMLND